VLFCVHVSVVHSYAVWFLCGGAHHLGSWPIWFVRWSVGDYRYILVLDAFFVFGGWAVESVLLTDFLVKLLLFDSLLPNVLLCICWVAGVNI
jgi:hypothetical protein